MGTENFRFGSRKRWFLIGFSALGAFCNRAEATMPLAPPSSSWRGPRVVGRSRRWHAKSLSLQSATGPSRFVRSARMPLPRANRTGRATTSSRAITRTISSAGAKHGLKRRGAGSREAERRQAAERRSDPAGDQIFPRFLRHLHRRHSLERFQGQYRAPVPAALDGPDPELARTGPRECAALDDPGAVPRRLFLSDSGDIPRYFRSEKSSFHLSGPRARITSPSPRSLVELEEVRHRVALLSRI